MNGLGSDGVASMNTGRGSDLDGAVLACNTNAMINASLRFSADTVLPNTRVQAIRMQYRLGSTGALTDLLDGGDPVEYTRNSSAGHSTIYGVISRCHPSWTLPSTAAPTPTASATTARTDLRWRVRAINELGGWPHVLFDTAMNTIPPLQDSWLHVPAPTNLQGLPQSDQRSVLHLEVEQVRN